MFRNKIVFLFTLAFFTLVSCEKKLDQVPEGALYDTEAITDFQTLQAATVGIYDGLTDINYYGRNYPTILELRGNNMYIAVRNSNRLLSSFRYLYPTTDGDVTGIWNSVYNMIQRANQVINRSGNVKDADATEIDPLVGEAYFLRALGHFDLVRVFGKQYALDNGASLGVPIMTKFEIGTPARSTVAQVYDQVIADLQQAESMLPEDPTTKFRATRMAATALLARVYLYKEENALAVEKATEVIESGLYSLTDPSLFGSGVFWRTPGSDEEIFTIKVSQFEDRGSDNYGQLYNPPPAYADVRVYPSFANSYAPSDVRRGLIRVAVANNGNRLFTRKFEEQDNIPGLYSPKILRLAELYFIRAEASVKLGDGATALQDLNTVRDMRGLPNRTTEPTLEEVLEEKNWEFAFEGHQWQDRLRNGLTTPRPTSQDATGLSGSEEVAVDDYKQLFPIPQREIDANPAMKAQQNPGYQ